MAKRTRRSEAELQRRREVDALLEELDEWSRRADETIRRLEKLERRLRRRHSVPSVS